MCDHCGCRQGVIGALMDQHEAITALGSQVRRHLENGDQAAARRDFDELLAVLEPHLAWEEVGLFPRLAGQGDFAAEVEALEAEHVSVHQRVWSAPDDPAGWAAAITGVLDDLDAHIYRENFGLFPAAISVLTGEDWTAIDAAIAR